MLGKRHVKESEHDVEKDLPEVQEQPVMQDKGNPHNQGKRTFFRGEQREREDAATESTSTSLSARPPQPAAAAAAAAKNGLGHIAGTSWWERRADDDVVDGVKPATGGRRKRMLVAQEAREKLEAEW